MGNQMPNRCMVPCNPVCCAMCFHQDTGREADGEHKTGSIFANAASVLSMAAEEISLDDHLEKELANEVELWRMETSSTAVHTTDAYRTVFAPLDKFERNTIDSNSMLSSPGGRLESIEDIDDLTDYGDQRMRSSDPLGGRRKLVPGGNAAREGTGLSTESSGLRPTTSSPVTQSREETVVTWREVTSQAEATSALSTAAPSSGTNFGDDGKMADETLFRDRVISLGARPPPTGLNSAQFGPAFASVVPSAGSSSLAQSLSSRSMPQDGAKGSAVPATSSGGSARRQEGQPSDKAVAQPAQDSSSERWLPLSRASEGVPEHDQALPRETSSFSSTEDSFPGFIEDPLEKELPDEVQGSPGYLQGAWNVQPSDGYYRDSEGRFHKSREPDPMRRLPNGPDGVRADRDVF